MIAKFNLDDRKFQQAIRKYASVSSLGAGAVVKKRALRISLKLYFAYRKLAPSLEEIERKAVSLDYALLIRPSISKSKGSRANKVKREISSRKRSITYTAMGWVVAAKRANLPIRAKVKKKFRRKVQGEGKSRLKGRNPYVIIHNTIEGASAIESEHRVINRILKSETADMIKYIERKTLKKHAKKSGF